MVSLLTVFVALTAVYVGVLVLAVRSGSQRFQAIGPMLMVRTQVGKKLIDHLSKGRGWGVVADVFVVLTLLAGLVMLAMVVYQNTLIFTHTDIVRDNPPRFSEALAIPGVNPVIPVGYGLVALVVALVIHEGGHGVLARFAQLPVKSLGLVFFVIPIGAFVEPDEGALQRTSLRNKLRLFAAGPGPNLVLATVCVLLISQLMAPAIQPAHNGVAIMGVSDGLPADQAGLEPGMFITAMGDQPVETYADFRRVLDESSSEAPLEVRYWHRESEGTATIIPLDRYEYIEQVAPDANNETNRGVPFLGVTAFGVDGPGETSNRKCLLSLRQFDCVARPFEELGYFTGSLFYIAMPFAGLQPAPSSFHDIYDPTGFFEGWGTSFWVTLNMLYWLFWINLVLGTFNALPLGPLDGGHMFRHSLHAFFRKRRGISNDELTVVQEEGGQPYYVGKSDGTQMKLDAVDRNMRVVNHTMGWTLLVLILAPLIVPQFL